MQKGRFEGGPLSAWAEACSEKMIYSTIAFSRPGSDLLSRVLRRSTIGAGVFHGRVRNGNGWGNPAMTTRSAKGKTMRMHGFVSVCWALANLSCSAYRLARVPKRGYGHVCHALHVVSRSWIYSTCGCFWQPYRPGAVAACAAARPERSGKAATASGQDGMFIF